MCIYTYKYTYIHIYIHSIYTYILSIKIFHLIILITDKCVKYHSVKNYLDSKISVLILKISSCQNKCQLFLFFFSFAFQSFSLPNARLFYRFLKIFYKFTHRLRYFRRQLSLFLWHVSCIVINDERANADQLRPQNTRVVKY